MAELTKQEVVRIIYLYAADLMDEGMTVADIQHNLIGRGLSPEATDTVVAHLMSAQQSFFAPLMEDVLDEFPQSRPSPNLEGTQVAMPTRPMRAAPIAPMKLSHAQPVTLDKLLADALRRAANRDMGIGVLLFVVGIFVTVGTLAAASGGGTYVVAYGALIFGPVMFVRGMIRMNKANKVEQGGTESTEEKL